MEWGSDLETAIHNGSLKSLNDYTLFTDYYYFSKFMCLL